ncbi:molybdate ABC transporter substrate-binding protein [Xanthobacteraceae bacterium Astr-EGSB]|uniref:molybdate ABC transporter substrate-binding protein n=1 Tax=Astrobacterium formosum TaxID=3069710 RepID=UPI0027B3E1EF|nr:molybdate ABC transporter substrate-binding protein [Xanthobacteraceae bacterium Astr-EGSB]
MSRQWWRTAALVGVAVASCSFGQACADEVTLAAGAGFRRPIGEIATAFEATSGHKVLQVYGHLGQVFAQARESGQVSLVCGDKVALESAPGLKYSRMARLGLGKLVIAYRKGLAMTAAADIARPEFRRIGIPDQAQAIYGKAGRQFLQRSGLAAAVDPRLVAVATVPQVTSYVASGEVDAGFLNATEAMGAAGNLGGLVEVAPDLYDAVEVVCAITSPAKDGAVAEAFADFLATERARAILTRHGL